MKKSRHGLSRSEQTKLFNDFLCITLSYFMEIGAFAKTDDEERPIYTIDDQGIKHYELDEDKLSDAYSSMDRWLNAIEDHMISIGTVRDIIFRKTGYKPFN